MSLQLMQDDSFLPMKGESKTPKKRRSNFNMQNQFKGIPILQPPLRLNQSISKLRRKSNNERNIIKDYLHLHKFGLQRKKTRKITVKALKSNADKSFMFNNSSHNEAVSMVYYPEDKKKNNKKINTKLIELKKETTKKTNLKHIENSLFLKLHNMKSSFQQIEGMNNIDNINDDDNFLKIKTCKTNNISNNCIPSHRSSKNNLPINNSYYVNKFRNSKKISLNSCFNRQNSTSSNMNSNVRSSIFAPKQNENNENSISEKTKSDFLPIHNDKSSFELEKNHLKFNEANHNSLNLRFLKRVSTQSINLNVLAKEKARNLSRIKPLYDSFDDDESDKDEEYDSNALLPSSPIIFFLDIFIFMSSLYTLLYIPLRMARADCFCTDENKFNKILLYFIDVLYIYDFCISFFRGYYDFQLKLIKNHSKIIIHYLKTDGFFDFIESIPLFSFSKYICANHEETNYCFNYNMSTSLIIFEVLTNIKIIKIFKVRNKQKNITFNFILDHFSENYSLEKFLDNLFDLSFFLLAFHFFVCLNIFLAKQTYPNWIITINTQDRTLLYNYITSSYSLIETLTTVGYGDVVCQNLVERIFQIFFLGVGVIAYSYIISSFGNLIKNESQSSIKYNNSMRILEEIRVDYPNMPFKLYNKIYNYIESRNVAEKKLDANMLTNSLPFNLRNALLLLMFDTCIKNFKLFKNCDNSNFIIQVLSKFVPAVNKKSEIIVYEGEMIEEIVIVKDGRLSLEAAIDIDEPEESIRNYFNINFQGITTAKEMKKMREANKRLNNSQLLDSKKTRDFDNAKVVLNNVVKKQVNFLLNSECEDTSILDKTANDYNRKENEKTIHHLGSDFLRNEPIKNEQGNFKYIKIIDIRKNENFGGLFMFMRRPSPLSLKVKSKFVELYLLPKKDVFSIAKNYNNIWSKIHKKDFHNMLSIKHKTFNILNKYIEINGIGKISPNDVSRYVYAWEDQNKTKDNKLNDKSYLLFSQNMQNYLSPNPITINGNISSNVTSSNKVINPPNKNPIIRYISPLNITPINRSINNNNNQLLNKSIEKASPEIKISQVNPGDMDFSYLLTVMANGKPNIVNTNPNTNTNRNNANNTNNIIDNSVQNTINNDINLQMNTSELKESIHSNPSNFLNEKRKTNFEEGKTIEIPQESEMLFPSTLNKIFDENKADEIKEKMKKSKKKENIRKILSFGKKVAELFTNKNYSLILVDKNKDELIDLQNKSLNNEVINNYLSLCQNKLFLDKIHEMSFDEGNSIYQFDNKYLKQEEIISFSLESLYQNINMITEMEYSKNKIYQEKTIKFLKKLMDKGVTSSKSSSSNSSEKSSSFSNYLSKSSNGSSSYYPNFEKSKSMSLNISAQSSKNKNDIFKLSKEIKGESENKSKNFMKKQKKNKNHKKTEKQFSIGNSAFSKLDSEVYNKKSCFNSLEPKQIFNMDSIKGRNTSIKQKNNKNFMENTKFTFKIDTVNDDGSYNEKVSNHSKKIEKKKISNIEKKKTSKINSVKSSLFISSDNNTNIRPVKGSKTAKKNFLRPNIDNNNKSPLSDNKNNKKDKISKKKSVRTKLKSDKNLINLKEKTYNKDLIKNTLEYFSKEDKKEDCKIQ